MQVDTLSHCELVVGKEFDKAHVADSLDGVHMLRGMVWAQIEQLAGYMKIYKIKSGQLLFPEGAPGDFMCIVLSGKLVVKKEDSNKVEKVVATITKGYGLGEMSLMDREQRSATVLAAEPTLIAVLKLNDFQRMIQEKPLLAVEILKKVAQLLSQRLRLTSGVLVDYLDAEAE